MARPVAILGAGAQAREVLDLFEACNDAGADYEVVGFLVDPRFGSAGTLVNGKPILGGLTWLERRADVQVVCAVGAPEHRRELVARAAAIGAAFCTVVHPRAVLTKRVTLGAGAIVAAGAILTTDVAVGDHVLVNFGCTIGHDVRIEPFATISPGANLSGNVTVETGAYVGTGAAVIEKLRIGRWSVVGAGAAVVRDVPPNSIVAGNPARVLRTRPEGWHL